MSRTLRTYRLAPALLALVLVLTSAGPLLDHLCTGAAPHATVTEQAHHCCGDDCPERSDAPSEESPAGDACCVVAPAAPAESPAVAAPAAPRADAVLFAVVATLWAEATEAPPVRPALADTGGPPLPVRSHLALSVLLI
jgi:hypothetical protein